jgi:hypothetical protein
MATVLYQTAWDFHLPLLGGRRKGKGKRLTGMDEKRETMRTLVRHGAVAFIDLLGFSGRLRNETDHSRNTDFISKFAGAALDACTRRIIPWHDGTKRTVCHDYVLFSDSVVIYPTCLARDDTRSLFDVLDACSRLSFLLLEMGQPFRGCIAQGTYYLYRDRGNRGIIVAGKPVIEAFEWEEKQKWIGIMLHPDIDNNWLRGFCDREWRIQNLGWSATNRQALTVSACDSIPICEESCGVAMSIKGKAVVPTREADRSVGESLESIKLARESLSQMPGAADYRYSAMYDATITWYKQIECILRGT